MAKKMSIAMTNKKKKEFLEKIVKNKGLIQATIDQVGISRYYYDMWIKDDPVFAEASEDFARITKSFAESKLIQLIDEGNVPATIFYLKAKGGYVETQHIKNETTYVEPLKINIVVPEQPQLDRSTEAIKLSGDDKKMISE